MSRADGKLDTLPVGDPAYVLGVDASGLPLLTKPQKGPWPANSILYPAHYVASGAAAVISNTGSLFVPFRIPRAVTLTKFGLYVTVVGSSGAQARLSLFTDNGGLPDALVKDGGTIALDSSTGHLETTAFSQAVDAGDYWGLIAINNIAGATFDRYGTVAANWVFNTSALAAGQNVQRYYTNAAAYGAPPANAASVTSGAGNAPIMTLRN
jgi:hypothetical protein